jgi:RNA polymerase sigma-70 factor, ECF subfamily
VFTIARNRLRDEYRRRRRRPVEPVAEVPEVASEEDPLAGVLTAEARELLDSLTRQQREVLLLRVFADLSLEDVATIVGRPVSAVKSLQHRALATLRKKITHDPYPDGPVWR